MFPVLGSMVKTDELLVLHMCNLIPKYKEKQATNSLQKQLTRDLRFLRVMTTKITIFWM